MYQASKPTEFEATTLHVLMNAGVCPSKLASTTRGIRSYYTQGHRAYHGTDHILDMLHKATDFGWRSPVLDYAILMHDVFWQPGNAGVNEGFSQEIAEQLLPDDTHVRGVLEDEELIRKTQYFMEDIEEDHTLVEQLLDLDISTLGEETFYDFCEVQDDIAREGLPKARYREAVSDNDRAKTAKFMASWAENRDWEFFYTAQAKATWNDNAVANIKKYIETYGEE